MAGSDASSVGARLERAIDDARKSIDAKPEGALLLGMALGTGVIVGGAVLFLVVWAVLVGLFA